MKVVIVFESMFGNTEALARDVMGGLTDGGADVVLANVASAPVQEIPRCDLLVLAAPTHALTLSRPATRAEAVTKGADPSRSVTGVREWLTTLGTALPPTAPRPSIAVFDTRVSKVRRLPGSAARSVTRTLKKKGFVVVDRVSFYVEDIPGPLSAGEHERARAWGRGLAGPVHPGGSSRDITGRRPPM
jgi:hypothetical protein